MDIDRGELTEKDMLFLSGTAKRKKLFLMSSAATVVVAVSFLVYHGLIARDMNGLRFAVIIILLLSGRTYLRLYKSAVIFSKLKSGPLLTAARNASGTETADKTAFR
jgi:hypothetical protein